MANKKFWLGILVLALVFGMTVVGCDDNSNTKEEDVVTSSPTGLQGTVVSPNNSVRLTWNSVSNAEEYCIESNPRFRGGPTDHWYSSGYSPTTNYTVTDLDYMTSYNFRVYGIPWKNEKIYYSSPITIETGKPLTGSVSLSMETTHSYLDYLENPHIYDVSVTLTLSGGPWWDFDKNANRDFIRSWVTFSGSPSVNDWYIGHYGFSDRSKTLKFRLSCFSKTTIPISGLTASINASKISEMNNYTQIINSLSVGSPSTVSSSVWAEE